MCSILSVNPTHHQINLTHPTVIVASSAPEHHKSNPTSFPTHCKSQHPFHIPFQCKPTPQFRYTCHIPRGQSIPHHNIQSPYCQFIPRHKSEVQKIRWDELEYKKRQRQIKLTPSIATTKGHFGSGLRTSERKWLFFETTTLVDNAAQR